MALFQQHSITLLGLSVDPCEESARLKRNMALTFELLSDVERAVLKDWSCLNAHERGGIAFPNVYVIETTTLEVVFHSRDRLATRVDSKPILDFLEQHRKHPEHRMSNDLREYTKPGVKDLLLAYPKKWRWIKS